MNEITIFLVAILGFGFFCLYVIRVVHKRNSTLDHEFYKQKWQDIENMAQSEVGWVQAIVEADKLLDDALKKSGYKGKTMAERLVSASRAFQDKDRTWAAHKLRNRVVHETSIKLRQKHINGALNSFKKSLKDLGAL